MVTLREATLDDAEAIAQLYALSWSQNYKGIWSDAFLTTNVLDNRRQVWQERLSRPAANQFVTVASVEKSICGFGCAYANQDSVWGTLLDNLHVHSTHKGQGIGRMLLKSAARWAYQQNPETGFYLWVLAQNYNARKFYEKLGATNYELASLENPDGTFSDCYRCVWPDIKQLIA
jgi:ribosomal protein S18 acetylase RimI-like enzyme